MYECPKGPENFDSEDGPYSGPSFLVRTEKHIHALLNNGYIILAEYTFPMDNRAYCIMWLKSEPRPDPSILNLDKAPGNFTFTWNAIHVRLVLVLLSLVRRVVPK